MTKAMTSMTSEMSIYPTESDISKTAAFLADYAALLAGCGATCIRIEKNTGRMASAFGLKFDIAVMPAHVYVTVRGDDNGESCVVVRKVAACGISFNLNALLSRLSWEVADNRLDLASAVYRFDRIRLAKPTDKWEVLILTSLANASFCRLFGGDAYAMLIVFFTTLAGFRLKQIMLEDGCDVRLTFICASFFSAAMSAGGCIFNIGTTPELALGTSVLYLIPGVPYINAVSDIIERHYLCAFSRFMDAAVLTVCLSLGLCAGMLILGLKWF